MRPITRCCPSCHKVLEGSPDACDRCGHPMDYKETKREFEPVDYAFWRKGRKEANKARGKLLHGGPSWIVAPVVVIVLVMILTNPSRQAFGRWATNDAAQGSPSMAIKIAQMGSLVPSAFSSFVVDHNYLLFSVFRFSAPYGGGSFMVVGLFGHFIQVSANGG